MRTIFENIFEILLMCVFEWCRVVCCVYLSGVEWFVVCI